MRCAEPHLLQDGARALVARLLRDPGIQHGQLHVLQGARSRQKIEALKDEADLPAADGGKLVPRQPGDLLAGKDV